MAKILFHLGMPKTATTVLQNLFFAELHKQGKINYLGKREDQDITPSHCKQEQEYHCIYKKTLYPLRFGTNFNENFQEHKKLLNSIIDKKKINVISDENFFFAFQNQHNHTQVFDKNLAKRFDILFSGHQLSAFCILRKQASFLYSWYAFHYPKIWFYMKNNDNISNYYKILTSEFQKKKEMLFYADIMSELDKKFSQLSCFFYEALLADKVSYYQKIACLLGVEITDKDIPEQYLNQSPQTKLGIKTVKIFHPEVAVDATNYKFTLYKILIFISKSISRICLRYNPFLTQKQKNKLYEKLINSAFATLNILNPKIHPYWTKEQKQTIANLCRANNKKLVTAKFCTEQDLKKYNYL